uniref:Ribosomal protein L32 n=1 Tax=Spongospora subterranea TaxID=70186 RepID=A0A0H5RAF1_9EUKA|eukprot:CRZ10642.1 hypothetical protein [Spongospora subterranea]
MTISVSPLGRMLPSARSMMPILSAHIGAAEIGADLDLLACPKKKVSVFKRRLRRAGHRGQLGCQYKPYKVCPTCGTAVEMHYLCMKCTNAHIRHHRSINT